MEKALDKIDDAYNIIMDKEESQKLCISNKHVLNDVEDKLSSHNDLEQIEFCKSNEELKNNCINRDKRGRMFIEIICDENENNEEKKNMSSVFDLCNGHNDGKIFFSPSSVSSPISTFSFADEYMQSLNTMDIYIKSDIDSVSINKKCDLSLTPKFSSLSLNEPECERKIKDTSKCHDLLSTSSCSPHSFYYECSKQNCKIKKVSAVINKNYKNNKLEKCIEFANCKKEESHDKSNKNKKIKYLYNEDDDLLALYDPNNSETIHQLSFANENKATCLSKIGLFAFDVDLSSLNCYDASFISVLNNEEGFSEENENMQKFHRSTNCSINNSFDSNNSSNDIKNINNVTYMNEKKTEELVMKEQKDEKKEKKKQIETNKYAAFQSLNEFINKQHYLSDENNKSNIIKKKITKHTTIEKSNETFKQNKDKISESSINLNETTKRLKKQGKIETRNNSKKKNNGNKENYLLKYKNVDTFLTNINNNKINNFSTLAGSNTSNTKACSKKFISSLNRLPYYVIPSPPPIPPPPADIPEPPAIPPPPSTNDNKMGKNYDNFNHRVCNNANRGVINNSVQVRSNKKNKRNKHKKIESNNLKIDGSLQSNSNVNLTKPNILLPFFSCLFENEIFTNNENIVQEEIQMLHNSLNKNYSEKIVRENEYCTYAMKKELKEDDKQDKNIVNTSNFNDVKECNSNITAWHSMYDENDILANKNESNKCLSFFHQDNNDTMCCNYNYPIEKEAKVENISSSFSLSDFTKFSSCTEKENFFDTNNGKAKIVDIDIDKMLKKKDEITYSNSFLTDATPVFFNHPQLYGIGLGNVESNNTCFLFSTLESLFSSSPTSILSTKISNLPISSDIKYMKHFCYIPAYQGMLKSAFKNVDVNKKNDCSLSASCLSPTFTLPLLLNNPYIYADALINNAASLNCFNNNIVTSDNYNYNNSSTIFNACADNDNTTQSSSNILHDTSVSPSLLSVQQCEPIIDTFCAGNFTMKDDNKNVSLGNTITSAITNIFGNDIYNIENDKNKDKNILIDENEYFRYLTMKNVTHSMETLNNDNTENNMNHKARTSNCTNFKSGSIQYTQQSVPDYIQHMFNCLSAEQLSLAVQQTVRYED